jgi:transcription-repair coupling factor (superfamily II helicase)
VAWNEMQARQALTDLSWLTGDRAIYLPSREIMLYDVEARSFEQTYDRITALIKILEGDYDFVVTSAEAILHQLMPPHELSRYLLELKTGPGKQGLRAWKRSFWKWDMNGWIRLRGRLSMP